jgi:peroxiredoxin
MESILVTSMIVLWATVLFNLFLTLALVRRVNMMPNAERIEPVEMLPKGETIPNFSAQTSNGSLITLADYQDKFLAIVFVSPDCSICKEHMGKIQEIYPQAQRIGVEIMVISLSDSMFTREYAEELKFTAPILSVSINASNKLRKDLKIPGTPSYYLVDKQHKIVGSGIVDKNWEQLVLHDQVWLG